MLCIHNTMLNACQHPASLQSSTGILALGPGCGLRASPMDGNSIGAPYAIQAHIEAEADAGSAIERTSQQLRILAQPTRPPLVRAMPNHWHWHVLITSSFSPPSVFRRPSPSRLSLTLTLIFVRRTSTPCTSRIPCPLRARHRHLPHSQWLKTARPLWMVKRAHRGSGPCSKTSS